MQASGKTQAIREPKAMLQCAAGMEEQSANDYNRWANECGANADSATKRIFEDLVADEERHYDQFATELENLGKFGENYLALQSIERSKTLATPTTPA
jgi:bacterioferritin